MNSNDILKNKFMPRFLAKAGKNSGIYFLDNSLSGLHYGIEQLTTNGLGYKKIRSERESVKTPEDLKNHLGKMEDRIIARGYNSLESTTFALIRHINYLEHCLDIRDKFVTEIHPKLDKIFDYIENNKDAISWVNYLKSESSKEEIKKEEVPVKKVLKKKEFRDLLSKIFS